MYKKDQFYIIRAERAGVFLCKILKEEGNTLQVNNLRRLYRWAGALDVTQIAKEGISNPNNCKFSVQLGSEDTSLIYNVIEAHTCTEKALQTLNSVLAWKQ